MSEISFKTDPESTDYVVEAGATRNFMALKLAEEQAVREMEAEKEEERTNPMKVSWTSLIFLGVKSPFVFLIFIVVGKPYESVSR